VGASALVQTGPGAYPASHKMGDESFPGARRTGSGVTTHTSYSPGQRKSIAIPLLPLWTFVTCSRVTFTFTHILQVNCNLLSGSSYPIFSAQFPVLQTLSIHYADHKRPTTDPTAGQMQPVNRQTFRQLDIFYCPERAHTFGCSIKPSTGTGRKINYKTSTVHLFLY